MDTRQEKKYENLSPFELKNKLIDMAEHRPEKLMLNAGRGNPNWVALEPRFAFTQIHQFALEESTNIAIAPGFGGAPKAKGSAGRLRVFLGKHRDAPGVHFLTHALAYATKELQFDEDQFVWELVDAILGDHYPVPDRILNFTNAVVTQYFNKEMFAGDPPKGKFDLFATEGGTAAMDYIFTTLVENEILKKGDKIAIGVPIFTPYLEIPKLNDYEFVELEVIQDENGDWQYPDSEIEKLRDNKIKAFFTVNPSNPTSVSMSTPSLDKLKEVVEVGNKELIIITDDVYGTFVNDFRSLAAILPHNTILVYSFSKYFGATGWRLGVIGVHEDNILDKKVAALSASQRAELEKRYEIVALDPANMKVIERMVADSRSVALHHTAGLSTPQQVMMTFFALHALLDTSRKYKDGAQGIVKKRYETLYDALGTTHPDNPYDARYYTTIDIPRLAKERFGEKFQQHLVKNHEPIDFVVKLAEEKGVVLMDGGGFDSPNMSVRVSLANLEEGAYKKIGHAISELLQEYYDLWKESK